MRELTSKQTDGWTDTTKRIISLLRYNFALDKMVLLISGVQCAQRIMILGEDSKPLEEQSRHPRGDTRLVKTVRGRPLILGMHGRGSNLQ